MVAKGGWKVFGVIRSTWTDINRVDDCEDGARDSEWIHLVSVLFYGIVIKSKV